MLHPPQVSPTRIRMGLLAMALFQLFQLPATFVQTAAADIVHGTTPERGEAGAEHDTRIQQIRILHHAFPHTGDRLVGRFDC